ncbi:MAG: hypothetical protein IPH80_11895 [Myxococcales bacterium]|nr:hypothetical protein [Myxococcales bacterium]
MKAVGVELAAPAPAAPAARPPARDDRFQRTLDERGRDDADDDTMPSARPPRASRRLGDRREAPPAGATLPNGIPARADDLELEMRRWLTSLSIGAVGGAAPMAGAAGVGAPSPAGGQAAAAPDGPTAATAATAATTDATAVLEVELAPAAPAAADAVAAADPDAGALVDAVTAALARTPRGPTPTSPDAPAPVDGPSAPTLAAPPAVAAAPAAIHDARAALVAASAPEPRDLEPRLAPPAPTDRARLVLDHDGERVVVSVAVRHGAVSVAIDAAASTLGAAVGATLDRLDAALHSHGLHLADLTSGQPHGGGSGQAGSAPTPRRPTDGAEPADEPRPALTLDPRLRALA